VQYGLVGGQYRPLTKDRVGRIHQSALRILEEVGIHVELPEAADVFRDAGARPSPSSRAG